MAIVCYRTPKGLRLWGKEANHTMCKDASASLEPKVPKSHQEQATDAVNSLL